MVFSSLDLVCRFYVCEDPTSRRENAKGRLKTGKKEEEKEKRQKRGRQSRRKRGERRFGG